jgi:hypothetical protein
MSHFRYFPLSPGMASLVRAAPKERRKVENREDQNHGVDVGAQGQDAFSVGTEGLIEPERDAPRHHVGVVVVEATGSEKEPRREPGSDLGADPHHGSGGREDAERSRYRHLDGCAHARAYVVEGHGVHRHVRAKAEVAGRLSSEDQIASEATDEDDLVQRALDASGPSADQERGIYLWL